MALLMVACAQLKNGQTSPVRYKNIKEKIMFTNCGGAVEHWGSCYEKANDFCKTGYQVLDKKENSNGTVRDLTFQCKK